LVNWKTATSRPDAPPTFANVKRKSVDRQLTTATFAEAVGAGAGDGGERGTALLQPAVVAIAAPVKAAIC